jgi:hypothetical protein
MKFGKGKEQKQSATVELPGRSDKITIVPLSGARVPARVIEAQTGTLLVAITVPIDPLSNAQLQALLIEFQGPKGRVHLTGTASIADPSEPDVLRIDDPREIDTVQEREYVRIRSARPALVFGGPEMIQINSHTVDISGGGFLLSAADALKVGDRVHFQLELPEGELPIAGSGKVVRVDPNGHRGIVFDDDIKELDRRRLIRYIFDCQRVELRRGLEVGRHGA